MYIIASNYEIKMIYIETKRTLAWGDDFRGQ